jgi:hypothetical protein
LVDGTVVVAGGGLTDWPWPAGRGSAVGTLTGSGDVVFTDGPLW